MLATILSVLGTLIQPFVGVLAAAVAAWYMKTQGEKQQAATDTNATLTAAVADNATRNQIDENVAASAPQEVSGPSNPDGLHTTTNDSGLSQWSTGGTSVNQPSS